MRKALNDNPVLQIVILGVLGVGVAFLLMTRVMHKSDSSSSATTTPTTSATAGTSTAPTDGSTAGAPGTATGAVPPTAAPSTTAPVAPSPGGDAAVAGALSSKLIPGPGLPKPVARAYADGKAIVLFVFRNRGIDDAAVRKSVERLQGRSDLAVFVTHAAGISRYARITEGVNVNQVPALVVVRPRQLSQGAPTATVSYGFRGPDSVQQAVRDGLYRGPSNLPYYPR